MSNSPSVTPTNFEYILDCPCMAFASIQDVKAHLLSLVTHANGGYSVAINAEKIMGYKNNAALREVIDSSYFPFSDGAGAVLGLKILCGRQSIKIDLPRTVLELSHEHKLRLFIAGTTEDANFLAVERIKTLYDGVRVVGRAHGYTDESIIIEKIGYSDPQIVLLALGSPKQELFAARLIEKYPSVLVIGCGGALNVLAGKVNRAPSFMIENNLEWLYRLWKEPQRWRRQLKLPLFVGQLIGELIKRHSKF